MGITERQNAILNLIVEIFTKTHEPVGSKALQSEIASSSATIRNDMATLEKMGLLEKAHTSSGRMPSIAGFKYFAEHSLNMTDVDEGDVYQVIKAFDFEAFTLDSILKRASEIIADLTGYTALVMDVEPRRQKLTAFEIVALSHHDALAVMTLDEANPITVQFAIPRNFLASDLVKLSELVRERFLNQTVLDIHYKLRTEIPQVVQKYFTTTDNVLDLFDYIFQRLFEDNVFVAGKVNALNYSDHQTYQLLDQPQLIATEIRESMADEEANRVQVAENKDPALSQLTVMSQKFLIPYRGFGILTLIGPVDMDYRRSNSILMIVGRVLAAKLGDYYRYLNSNHYEVN